MRPIQGFLITFAVFAAVISEGCGTFHETDAQPAIKHGETVTGGNPVLLSTTDLNIQKGSEWFSCSGTLIAPDVVLTAAHCISGANLALATIQKQDRRSNILFVHPDFHADRLTSPFPPGPSNDIAVIKLISAFARPAVSAALAPASPKSGETLVVAGFGEDEKKNAGVLHSMLAHISGFKEHTLEFGSSIFAAATGFGDSGGPAYQRVTNHLVVAGVISRTVFVTGQDIYTDVASHRAWIECVSKSTTFAAGKKCN